MARNTDISLRNQLIYSVYLRAQTEEGTFLSLIPELDRIRALGTDIIWLMPIHPIGEKNRKGSLGCPYAIRDYRGLNPAYGSYEDFRRLTEEIHKRGMKCIIDVVYNHTSPDAALLSEHPEFYYRNAAGEPCNKIGDWADVVDLDYTVPALWDYQIETLCRWAELVDGFRCDVASFVPVDFWKRARERVEQIRPGAIWLAESVHLSFGNQARREGFYSCRDSELFEAFDLEYDYDIRESFDRYIRGEVSLSHWLDNMNFQEAVYPENYNKMRCLENHDQPRAAALVPDPAARENYTAMLFFLKGTVLLYGGQEFSCTHQPSLFEREVFPRSGENISHRLAFLSALRRRVLDSDDGFCALADDKTDIAILLRENARAKKLGIFSLKSREAEVSVPFPDGIYENLLSGEEGERVEVSGGRLFCKGRPILLVSEKA